ncbi:MAG: hypothetical protein KDE52_12350 [Calditrichaeota bacterium]|nr:hypothetical protein [Calditrichota bacterium]
MFFNKKRSRITINQIIYDSDTHILVDYNGNRLWLRRSRISIVPDDDGKIEIELSNRYLKDKLKHRKT